MIDALAPATIPATDEALRHEVRAFLREHLRDRPLEARARSWMGFDAEFSRALAARGWVGLTLPVEYGGGGRSPFARFVLIEELLAAGAPVGAHWIADRQSGPLLLKYGTEAQKRFHLPRICRAESFFCIGMSEPQSGSDLASVRTRAERDGDGWRLSGQKLWTTHAPRSENDGATCVTYASARSSDGSISRSGWAPSTSATAVGMNCSSVVPRSFTSAASTTGLSPATSFAVTASDMARSTARWLAIRPASAIDDSSGNGTARR